MRLSNMLHHVNHACHSKAYEIAHGGAHLAYFAAVFVEGHGLYSTMGGVLLGLGLLSFVAGEYME